MSWPMTSRGVGTVVAAGRWSTSGLTNSGFVVHSFTCAAKVASIAWPVLDCATPRAGATIVRANTTTASERMDSISLLGTNGAGLSGRRLWGHQRGLIDRQRGDQGGRESAARSE